MFWSSLRIFQDPFLLETLGSVFWLDCWILQKNLRDSRRQNSATLSMLFEFDSPLIITNDTQAWPSRTKANNYLFLCCSQSYSLITPSTKGNRLLILALVLGDPLSEYKQSTKTPSSSLSYRLHKTKIRTEYGGLVVGAKRFTVYWSCQVHVRIKRNFP